MGGLHNKHYLGRDRMSDPPGNRSTEIRSKPGTIQPLEWYKLKISLRGPRIRIELDDHSLFDCSDDFSQKGLVELRCYTSAGGRFRNIKVTAPDGAVLWEGPPDLGGEKVPGAAREAAASVEGKPAGTPAAAASRSPEPKPAAKPRMSRSAHSRGRAKSTVPQKEITNTIGMKLVLIPAGEFDMGSPASDQDAFPLEKPQHRVRITRPFYLGVTEVTQGQYWAVTGKRPSHSRGSDDLPVEMVSWIDAIAFCNKLSELVELKPFYPLGDEAQSGGSGYRLPTEAEWEYACRLEARPSTASVTTPRAWASLLGAAATRMARPIRWVRGFRMPGVCTT